MKYQNIKMQDGIKMSQFIYFNYIKSGIKILPCDKTYFTTLGLIKEVKK